MKFQNDESEHMDGNHNLENINVRALSGGTYSMEEVYHHRLERQLYKTHREVYRKDADTEVDENTSRPSLCLYVADATHLSVNTN